MIPITRESIGGDRVTSLVEDSAEAGCGSARMGAD